MCKRIQRRTKALGIDSFAAYRTYCESHADEWPRLDAMCRVTISRIYRDADVFDALVPLLDGVRPTKGHPLRVWCAGCANGEEAVTWVLAATTGLSQAPRDRVLVTATDADPTVLERARRGRYPVGAAKELPRPWLQRAFERDGGELVACSDVLECITYETADIRSSQPDGPFDVIGCRNLVFTYFDAATQTRALAAALERLRPGGLLVIGKQEAAPSTPQLEPVSAHLRIFRRRG